MKQEEDTEGRFIHIKTSLSSDSVVLSLLVHLIGLTLWVLCAEIYVTVFVLHIIHLA